MNPDARISTVSPLVRPEIVEFPAEVDITNADALGARLLAALRPGVELVIADMTATHFCDSSGVCQLALADRRARSHLAQLRVVTARVPVLRVLQMTGLDQVLDIRPSMDSALADSRPAGTAAAGG